MAREHARKGPSGGSAMLMPRGAMWESGTFQAIGRETVVRSSQTRISTLETLPDLAGILSDPESPSQSVGAVWPLRASVSHFFLDRTSNILVTHALPLSPPCTVMASVDENTMSSIPASADAFTPAQLVILRKMFGSMGGHQELPTSCELVH